MPGPFKTALVVVTAIGSLTLAPSSALAEDDGATVSSGGASGCCRIAIN